MSKKNVVSCNTAQLREWRRLFNPSKPDHKQVGATIVSSTKSSKASQKKDVVFSIS